MTDLPPPRTLFGYPPAQDADDAQERWPIGSETHCYQCGEEAGHEGTARKIVALGPVVDHADPTQTYRLECGHLAI